MRSSIFTVLALALCFTAIGSAKAATNAGWDEIRRLAAAAYDSPACPQEAEALGIGHIRDAETLIAAIARGGAPGLGSGPVDPAVVQCKSPEVLLINLLRLNGIEAELVFVGTISEKPASNVAQSGNIDSLYVFVAVLDRYVDPVAPLEQPAVTDRMVRERARRIHLAGPSLDPTGRGACRDLCMRVFGPAHGSSAVRVRPEAIPGR